MSSFVTGHANTNSARRMSQDAVCPVRYSWHDATLLCSDHVSLATTTNMSQVHDDNDDDDNRNDDTDDDNDNDNDNDDNDNDVNNVG